MGESLVGAFGAPDGVFEGTVSLRVHVGERPEPIDLSAPWRVTLAANLTPRLYGFNLGAEDLFPADRVVIDGDGFLFQEEGATLVRLAGDLELESGGTRAVSSVRALTPTIDRRSGALLVGPDVLGPEPGVLNNGSITLVNQANGGDERESPDSLTVTLRMNRPYVFDYSPREPPPCRGQRVRLLGRGFLPGGQTLLRLDGRFYPVGEGGRPLDPVPMKDYIITPDSWVDGSTLEVALLTEMAEDGGLTGFAAAPGQFSGDITPILVTDRGEVVGTPYSDGFAIGPTRQQVWVRFLPTFSDALREVFGLDTVERRIRDRVLEVAARDYEGASVSFTDERPTGFAEFSIVEVGGPDPNHKGLFGLDNTEGKDTHNVRLDDIVGGENASSGEQGYYVFGGVFIESFLGFSPQVRDPLPIASPRFDQLLAPFAPFLCGDPVRASDLAGGPRAAQIDEAVRVLGNIIGGTVVHEIGHSLGMTQSLPGPNDFHNLGDNGYVMDAGAERSYEERAELDGLMPAWHPLNGQYLRSILPLPADGE